jgi:hypothetical protein
MSTSLSIECDLHVYRGRGNCKELRHGPAPEAPPPGRVPRVARYLALAHRIEGLVRAGAVRDYAEAARLGRVSRARVSQLVGLLNLAPDLQEQVLFLPRTLRGRDAITLRDLLPVAAAPDWARQRRMWAALRPA